MKPLFLSVILLLVLIFLAPSLAVAEVSPCGENCQVNYTTAQDVEEVLNEYFDSQSPVSAVRNDETGVFTVTLPDGRVLSLIAVGLTFRNQNMVQQRHMAETEEGHLRLRSQLGLEIQLRNALHHEAEVIGEMLRAQWTNMEWFRNRFEVESPEGVRMCLEPAMEIIPGQASVVNTTISTDEDGQLLIRYQDGSQQRLQACAHDMTQLRDQVRSMLQEQLQIHTDGTISVQAGGQLHRYRLEAALRWNGLLDQPGFFTEQNRLYFRYRDGWEQEIVLIS